MEFRLDIHVHFDEVLKTLLQKVVNTMATKQDVLDAMARERQQIVDAFTKNNADQDAKVKELENQIQQLKDAAAAGTATQAQDFDDLLAAVQDIYNDPAPTLPPPVTVDTPNP